MEKTVGIDGKDYQLVTNGATPRVYRGMFKKDVFAGMANAVDQDGVILDFEVFENLAYCMAVQGGSVSTGTKIEEWLAEMEDPLAIVHAAGDIMAMWVDENETTSTAKKE